MGNRAKCHYLHGNNLEACWWCSFNVTQITLGQGTSVVAFPPFFSPCLHTQEQLGPGEQMGTPLSEKASLSDSSSPSYLTPSFTFTRACAYTCTKQKIETNTQTQARTHKYTSEICTHTFGHRKERTKY